MQDIKELQKRSGYGWKAKLVVGWALEREVQDGLTVIDRRGNKVHLNALPLTGFYGADRCIAVGTHGYAASRRAVQPPCSNG